MQKRRGRRWRASALPLQNEITQGIANMEDHETRRKIIREATDRRTGGGIGQKGGPAKRVPSKSARSIPEVSARSVSEINGMAFAARWQIVIRRPSRVS